MQKFAVITIIAGLTMAFTTLTSSAAIVRPRNQPAVVAQTSHTNCDDNLVHVRTVHRADIDAINGQSVMLVHVCDDDGFESRNSYGSLFINGNVNTLRQPIARNNTLIAALSEEDLDENDVVSLRFGANNSVVLYVYDRDMR